MKPYANQFTNNLNSIARKSVNTQLNRELSNAGSLRSNISANMIASPRNIIKNGVYNEQ